MTVSFPYVHFAQNNHLPLSKLMILALIGACESQKKGTANGIKATFASLIQRGLIISKEATINGITESMWQVTAKALEILKNKGIQVPT